MEILITIAKFLGLIVTTILGVIALLGRTHEEVQVRRLIQIPGEPETQIERRITRWGKLNLLGILVGAGLGLAALTLDSVNQFRRNRDTLKKIEDQGVLAQSTLENIQHVVMRIENLKVTAKFEMPASAFNLNSLIPEDVRAKFLRLESFPNKQYVRVMVGTSNDLDSVMDNPLTSDGLELLMIAGRPDGETISIVGEETSEGFNTVKPITIKDLEKSHLPADVSNTERNRVLEFLRAPIIKLSIWRADTDDKLDGADFQALRTVRSSIELHYLFPSDKIQVEVLVLNALPKIGLIRQRLRRCRI